MLNSLLLLRQQIAQDLGQVGGGEPAVMDTRDFSEKEQTSAEMNRSSTQWSGLLSNNCHGACSLIEWFATWGSYFLTVFYQQQFGGRGEEEREGEGNDNKLWCSGEEVVQVYSFLCVNSIPAQPQHIQAHFKTLQSIIYIFIVLM